LTKYFFIILLCIPCKLSAQPNTDQQLAVQYFQNGEFDKAALYYEKLYDKNPNDIFYNYYLKCLIELKNYKEAEKLIKKQHKRFPEQLKFYVDLGYLYKLQNDISKAKKEYENAIKELNGDYNQSINLANAFKEKEEYDYALKTYEKAYKINSQNTYNLQKAEVYAVKGDSQRMIDEYLNLLDISEGYLNTIQNNLSYVIPFEQADNEKTEILRTEIIKRLQKSPNSFVYNDMLIWFYKQKGDFASAYTQLKAIDKRTKADGQAMFEFGISCLDNEQLDIAVKAFEYVVEKGDSYPFYNDSKVQLLEVLYKKIVGKGIYSNEELILLEKNYELTLQELGKNTSTVNLIRSWAKVKAFYTHDIEGATNLLNDLLLMPGINPKTKSEIKLEYADLMLIKGEIWDASLLYSQVEKANKNEPIGHEAKFRNAKISFYTSDFNWAKAQLDVLKNATSKLISNDAMYLSLLITDNIGMDSLVEPLTYFARADLLKFQNKIQEAEQVLDTLTGKYPWHSLKDDVHYLRYEIAKKKGDYDAAAAQLKKIIDEHSQDILADDALFNLAELELYYYKNNQKAAELYKKIIFDYPGSLYVVEARRIYRELRGDDKIYNNNNFNKEIKQ
jgi:tetratricopeptide (TPR) repeat protein